MSNSINILNVAFRYAMYAGCLHNITVRFDKTDRIAHVECN